MKELRGLALLLALFVIQIAVSCSVIKNGLGEPQTVQERTLPAPRYDSVTVNTRWNTPYEVLSPWENELYTNIARAVPDTQKQLPVTLRTYTIPVPTKK